MVKERPLSEMSSCLNVICCCQEVTLQHHRPTQAEPSIVHCDATGRQHPAGVEELGAVGGERKVLCFTSRSVAEVRVYLEHSYLSRDGGANMGSISLVLPELYY